MPSEQQKKNKEGGDGEDEAPPRPSPAEQHNRWAELASRWRNRRNVTALREEQHHTFLFSDTRAEIFKRHIQRSLLPPVIGTFLHTPAAQTSTEPICASKRGLGRWRLWSGAERIRLGFCRWSPGTTPETIGHPSFLRRSPGIRL